MSSERPQISIVVPVYNPGGYLAACLESIAGQTIFDQLEVILVDDGSTDGSQDACDAFAAEHPNARVIHQPNRGLSAARNAGMDAARAGYLLFVDSDDEIVPDACEVLLAAARSSGADLVWGGFAGSDVPAASAARLAALGPIEMWRYLKATIPEGTFLNSPCVQLVRTGFVRGNGLAFSGRIFENHAWLLHLLLHDATVQAIDFPFYVYNIGDHPSLSTQLSAKSLMDAVDTVNGMIDDVEAADLPDEVREVAEAFIASSIAGNALSHFRRATRAARELVRLRMDERYARYAAKTQLLPETVRAVGPAFIHDPELFEAELERLHEIREENLRRFAKKPDA